MEIKGINSEILSAKPQSAAPVKTPVAAKDGAEVKDEFQKMSPHNKRGLHKGFFAFATAVDGFARVLGGSGKFFTILDAFLGSAPGGLTAVMGIMGATQSIGDGAREAKISAFNRSVSGGISGSLEMIGGIGVLCSTIGFGPIPAFVGFGAYAAKTGFQLFNMIASHSDDKKPVRPQPNPA